MSVNRDDIFQQLADILQELFEIDKTAIKPESKLYEDLDLDSIDAVDLIAHLQGLTGRKFNPDEFKTVRTIDDVVTVISQALNA